VCPEKDELEAWIIKDMDRLLGDAWLSGNEDVFQQIFHLLLNENVSGNLLQTVVLGKLIFLIKPLPSRRSDELVFTSSRICRWFFAK